MTVSEECGLDVENAQQGIAWAIRTLVQALQQENKQHSGQ